MSAPDIGADRIDREIVDAEVVAEPTHDAQCWRVHDDCALQRAKEVLEADQSTEMQRDLLAAVRFAIADHAEEPCPAAPDPCYGVRTARRLLDSSVSGATEHATGDHDRGPLP